LKKTDSSKCLICEEVLPEGRNSLFCEKCEPDENIPSEETLTVEEYLPSEMLEDIISNMKEGDVGYTVPWAMFAGEDRRMYIVGTYSIHIVPGGTVHMRITKRNGEILIDKSSITDEKYTPGSPCYVGVTERDYIPVKLVSYL
jgi:hypothetical protein